MFGNECFLGNRNSILMCSSVFWKFPCDIKNETINSRRDVFAIKMSQEDLALLPSDSGIATPKRKNYLFKPTTGKIHFYTI